MEESIWADYSLKKFSQFIQGHIFFSVLYMDIS